MHIPTNYNGHTFRSIMEARWAVFFDYFGFHWDYEPVGWEENSEKYLPDFYIQDFDLYVEVKYSNDAQTRESIERAKRFARIRQINLAICNGNPHCRPLELVCYRPDFDLPVDTTNFLWFYKPGEGLLYEAKKPSERPEYREAVTKANNTRFGVLEIKNILGQARKKQAFKLQDELLALRDKHNIPQQSIIHLVKTICEFNEAACSRALHDAFKNKVDELRLEPNNNFDYNKGLNDLLWVR